jgi:trimeric autotransporter adhesin
MKLGGALAFIILLTAAPCVAQPTITGVMNGASLLSGPIAPGETINILGTGFATATAQASSEPLPTTLLGVSVMVGGTSAPVFSVSPIQVTVIAPAQLQPNTAAQVLVQVGTTLSLPYSVDVVNAAPGIFTANGNGEGQALAFNYPSGTLNSVTNPAPLGSSVAVFFTGGGQTNPPFTSIGSSSTSTISSLALSVVVGVNNNFGVPVFFAGLTPGFPGYDQVNFQIPADAASVGNANGVVPFQLAIAGTSTVYTRPGVTIAIGTVAASTLSAQPQSIAFSSNGALPPAQTVLLTSSGAPISFSVAATTASGGNWLSVQTLSGTTPASIPVIVNPGGLAPNTYSGTLTFMYSGATLSVAVTLTVTQQQPAIQAIITTVAGTAFTFPHQPVAALNSPLSNDLRGAALDAQGNLYVADAGNNVVVKIAAGGALSIMAGVGLAGFSGDGGPATSAALDGPAGVAVDSSGNIYISDFNNLRVRKVSGGIITTIAGNGQSGLSGDGVPATSAGFVGPTGLAVDSAGNLFIADYYAIRKVSGGTISTVAGNGQAAFSGDGGPATSASLDLGEDGGVAVDLAGNLYIADAYNNRIREVSDGIITTIAGSGQSGFFVGDNGSATGALLTLPNAVAVDSAGNLYISDQFDYRIRKITNGVITTIAGTGTEGFSGDGGLAINATVDDPTGVAVDAQGSVYVTDSVNQRIRKIAAGNISTIAGNGAYKYSGDGGPAASAAISPKGLALDAAANIYFADDSYRIRKVSKGVITTIAGNGTTNFSGDGGAATSAGLGAGGAVSIGPVGMAVDQAGNEYFTDGGRIRKISNGVISTVAGSGPLGFSGDDGPATSALLNAPTGIAVDGAGNLYIADSGNNRIREVSGGTITTIAGTGAPNFSGDGGPPTSASLNSPAGVAVDTAGNIYITDSDNYRIRKITKGSIATIAGSALTSSSGDGGSALAAGLGLPTAIAVDAVGNVYFSEIQTNRIRKISGGIINTVAGGGSSLSDGVAATSAALGPCYGLAVDSAGDLFISDNGYDRIREVLSAAPTFQVSSQTLSFTGMAGAAAPSPQLINLSSAVPGLNFSAVTNAPWLSVAPSSGSIPASIQVTADPSQLSAQNYTGMVTFTVPNATFSTQVVSVNFSVSAAPSGILAASTSSLPFSFTQGSSSSTLPIVVSNQGAGSISFQATASASSGGNWLSLAGGSGTLTPLSPATLTVTAAPGTLAMGTYSGAITITSPNTGQQLTLQVTMAITAPAQKILLSQLGFTFTAVAEGGSVPMQSLGILNTGGGELNYTVQTVTTSGGSWLTLSSTSGTVVRPFLDVSFVNIGVNAASLAPGTYYGQVQVSSGGAANSPQSALAVLTVLSAGSDPGPDVRPTGLIFIGVEGGGNPGSQSVLITNLASAPTSFSAVANYVPPATGWLTYQPTDATVAPNSPVQIEVQPNLSGLPSGSQSSYLNLAFAEGQPVVNVLSVIAPAGTSTLTRGSGGHQVANCTPSQLVPQFTQVGFGSTTAVGYPAALIAQVVDSCGSPVTTGSVIASFDNGDTPVPLVSLQDGTWTNSWQPAHSTANVTVTLAANSGGLTGQTKSAPLTLSLGQATPIFSTGPLTAATQTEGKLAPGDVVLIRGANLADGQKSSTSALETTLAGASLAIGTTLAQLLYVDSTQIVGLVPSSVVPTSQPGFAVSRDESVGLSSSTTTISSTNPAILTIDGSGHGQGVIYKLSGTATSLANTSNPVQAGNPVIIYCTGLGATDSSGVATSLPAVTIGSLTAPVTYAGLAQPQQYPSTGAPMILGGVTSLALGGLYQITATVPAGLATGAAPVIISSAGQTSQSGVTMMIAGSGSAPSAPAILAGGIVNAASYAAVNGAGAPVAPGSLVAIFTSALSAQPANFTTATLPPSLSGVSVTFNGVTAPLVQVVPSGAYPFVSAQVPFEVLSAGQNSATVPVVLTVNNTPSAPVQTQIVASQPGIFTLNSEGTGQAVLVNLADYTIAAPSGTTPSSHPIPRGQTAFFYVTGLGAVTPAVADGSGACPAATGLCNANAMPTVFVGGVPAQVVFAGQAPGYPGAAQINLTIPTTAPTGNAVSLTVKSADGTVTSNAATIAVQ